MHVEEVISTLATKVQYRHKMVNQLEKVFCVLECHSTKSVITSARIWKKVWKGSSKHEFNQKVYKNFVDIGCQLSVSAETTDHVWQAYLQSWRMSTHQVSCESNAPQPMYGIFLENALLSSLTDCRDWIWTVIARTDQPLLQNVWN